jgi:hypothetical protein
MPKNNFFNHLVGFSFSEKRFAKLLKFLLKNAREREREREKPQTKRGLNGTKNPPLSIGVNPT